LTFAFTRISLIKDAKVPKGSTIYFSAKYGCVGFLAIFVCCLFFTTQVKSQKLFNNFPSISLGAISLSIGVASVSSEIFTGSSVICDGGINVTASGSPGPFTYSVTIGNILYTSPIGYFPGLVAGSYSVEVTDISSGQKVDTTITVSYKFPQPSVTVSNVISVNSCDGTSGSFLLTGSGGTPPYLYSIDGGTTFTSNGLFTGLSQGLYPTIIKDAKGQIAQIGPNSSISINGYVSTNCVTCGCRGTVNTSFTACLGQWSMVATAFSYISGDSFSLDGVHYIQMIENPAYPDVYYYDTTGYGPGVQQSYIKDVISGIVTISAQPIIKYCYIGLNFVNTNADCQQNDGTIIVNASNGVPPYTYTIDGINYQTVNTFSGLSSGAYFVLVKDAVGGFVSQETYVSNNCPSVTASETDETCGQKNGTITATGNGGTIPYTFSIDGINFQSSNQFNGLASGIYIVTLKDLNGFTSTQSLTINNNCLLITPVIGNTTCSNSNGTITLTVQNGQIPYQYSLDGINYQTNNVFSNLLAGGYTVWVKDANSMTTSCKVTITDDPAPIITTTTTDASCNNTNGTIAINAIGGSSPLEFSIDNGINNQGSNSFNGLDSGSYQVIVKDANGCAARSTVQLAALPTTKFSLGNDTTLCTGATLQLNGPNVAGYQYLWQDNSTKPNYLVSTPGIWTLTVINQFGCSFASTVTVNYSPLPVFSIGNDTILCSGKELLVKVYPAITGNFLWSSGGTDNYLDINSPGIYWLQVTQNGCASKQSISVSYKNSPTVNLGRDTTLCEGQTMLLDATNPNAIYSWQDGSSSPTFTVNSPGMYSVLVDENGCDTSGKIKINYTTKPIIQIGQDTTLCVTQKLTVNVEFPNSSYTWQDGTTSPQYDITQEGMYKVEVTNNCGDSRDSILVKYENCACKFLIPNAFTPNRDGKNDIFQPTAICLFSNYQLKVFNRWGQLVFSSKNVSQGWNGEMGNQIQPAGTYVWEIIYTDNLTGKIMNKNGTVVLIR